MSNVTELRRARMRKGMLQVELAKKANVSVSMLCRYEKGWCNPTKKTAEAICDVLGVPVEDVFPDVSKRRVHQKDTEDVVRKDPPKKETRGYPTPRQLMGCILSEMWEYLGDDEELMDHLCESLSLEERDILDIITYAGVVKREAKKYHGI